MRFFVDNLLKKHGVNGAIRIILLRGRYLLASLMAVVLFCNPCQALMPNEILVLVNRNAESSVGLAKFYMEKRGIPEENMLQLWVTDKEECTREAYEKKIAGPVREYLEENRGEKFIRCILIMHGLPLKIAPPALTGPEKEELEDLRKQQQALRKRAEEFKKAGKEDSDLLKEEQKGIKERISSVGRTKQGASLDSELALVFYKDYSLEGWVPNPVFIGNRAKRLKNMPRKVLMVSRLDGPSSETVRRMIDDSIEAEKNGLKGTSYFDARWKKPNEEKRKAGLKGYALYDLSIHLSGEIVKKSGRTPVVINDKQELFQPGECPDAALYCGWYSLARYVDAFDWMPGAVGYHIASGECTTLKRPKSRVWCKMMLEKGVAATIGPVAEPYVQAFPVPEMFFGLLVDGRWNLAECYALSNPFLSWQMVLIGDPLYSPFKREGLGIR
jgi:uncharacterized protein (TIGR03790 family)